MKMKKYASNIEVFERYALEYDRWFEENRFAYESEILAVKSLISKAISEVPRIPEKISEKRLGLEIGVGTGRFAAPLGIGVGIEPARAMVKMAKKRGIEVCIARAEELPFKNNSFRIVLMIVTICFVQNPIEALREVKRVLKPGGRLIMGVIDRESFLGQMYERKKHESVFYRVARFYSVGEIIGLLKEVGFEKIETCQTIFRLPEKIDAVEPLKDGYGEGGFVVISAKKHSEQK